MDAPDTFSVPTRSYPILTLGIGGTADSTISVAFLNIGLSSEGELRRASRAGTTNKFVVKICEPPRRLLKNV